MKKIYFSILIFLATYLNVFAQLVDVVTGVNTPYEIAFNGNDLYVIEGGASKIIKIDVTASTPVAEDFLTGLNGITAIAINGNDLYYASIPGIFKVDITDNSQTLVEIVSSDDLDSSVGAMEIYNNQLYFSAIVNNNNGIHRTNLTSGASIEQLANLESKGMTFVGNNLYASVEFEAKVVTMDVTESNPVPTDFITGINGPRGIKVVDDYLYISEAFGGQLSRVDTSLPTSGIEVIATNLNFLYGLASNGNNLFIAEHSNNKISKLDTTTLAFEEFNNQNKVELFPNPSTDAIYIKGLKQEATYSIINIKGSIISNGSVNPNNNQIIVEHLNSGIYFLNLNKTSRLKFIKM